jgi:hypothetical protein
MDAKNNGNMKDTRALDMFGVSVRIITLHPLFLVYYDSLGWDPLYPSFYMPRGEGVGFTRKDIVGYNLIQPGLYLFLPIL